MTPRSTLLRTVLGALPALFATMPAAAASLQPVSDWGASGVPSTVSMYLYVPDSPAPNPPVLVLVHYCGGSAAAVFGQAQGGGLVAAADEHGFIMVVPQAQNPDGTGRCWDVGSTKALTRDGGGDTQAIAQMVAYTLTEHGANPDRVTVTGDSSGGMMTEALLALYPDVFRAGSAFAGVPAGCWAVSNPDGGWSGPCAGGDVTHTPEEWGDLVEGMFPGYAGPRPRVQLFHGDADTTIDYANHTEAIKEWTHVLGLSTSPTSTDTVQIGTHQATRQRWESSCGYVVLDAFTSLGGDHGPSDALFDADYVVPFLGLDQTGPTDPEIAECGGGAATGGGGGTGATETGGEGGAAMGGVPSGGTTTGGVMTGGTPPASGATSGGVTTGGAPPAGGETTGGLASTGGTPTTGGSVTTGGAPPSGGSVTTGGAVPITGGSGGSVPTGGVAATGGAGSPAGGFTSGGSGTATGGSSGAGGTSPTGGAPASGGSVATGGGLAQPAGADDSADEGGCGCRAAGQRSSSDLRGALALFALLALRSLRRRPGSAPRRP